MNTGGEAAEQIVRMSLEGFEVAAKITGAGAKNIAILLYSILKEEKKTKGKASRIHTKAKLPTHTLINDFEGLDKNSIILLEQVRTIDKQRLKQYLGMIPDNIVARVDKALAISVALEKTKATDV